MVRFAEADSNRDGGDLERDQYGGAQQHAGGLSTRGAVIGLGLLAIVLAALSWLQTAPWSSEAAVWTQASQIAPGSPWPWVNMAYLRTMARDPAGAEAFLQRATMAARTQPARIRDARLWGATDVIAAQLALVRMQQGRLSEASTLMQSPYVDSARGELCQRYPAICALSVPLPR